MESQSSPTNAQDPVLSFIQNPPAGTPPPFEVSEAYFEQLPYVLQNKISSNTSFFTQHFTFSKVRLAFAFFALLLISAALFFLFKPEPKENRLSQNHLQRHDSIHPNQVNHEDYGIKSYQLNPETYNPEALINTLKITDTDLEDYFNFENEIDLQLEL